MGRERLQKQDMNLLLDTEILQDYTGEPVSVSDAKAYMKVNFTDDDSLIESLIANAIRWLENYTGRSFKQRSMNSIRPARPSNSRP